ncbi:phosphonates import ATP-binding protein PhnC [Flavobacteriaceae bacterium UJ101]|nr:phosphonates import ATP-binding protein PhnC [Flavobacteriaceae bacterium UJ101]
MSFLEVKNLSIRFDQNTVLKNVSFSLKKKQILGLVGESGSGKSLTSYAITGLLPKSAIIDTGEIIFKGEDLLKKTSKELRPLLGKEIAMIFQEPMTSLNPSLTCGEQVLEAILLHENITKTNAKQKVIKLFEQVLLPTPERIFKSYPHQLSGGQKQRVMIAMALSCNPSLLIADEPTTALDVTVQKEILSLLKKLQQERDMSVIFISHDLGVIKELCDDVIVLFKGNIVEKNTVENIFSNPESDYTKGLIACRPKIDIRLKKLPTVTDFIEKTDFVEEIESVQERKSYQEELYKQTPLLEIKNLKKYYPIETSIFGEKKYFRAVDNVNFKIYSGETVGLVGESGCGKTTLSRTILQLQEATEGEIFYKGEDLTQLSKKRLQELRKEIQIIFQDPYSSLNPKKTIGQIIMEPMRVHKIGSNEKERKEKALYFLKRVGLLEEHLNRYPHEFSGGQRQRIGIARVLALNPEFIICDESVSALDVSVQAQVLNLLNELKQEFGFTYLFISHDLSVVKYMSNQLLVMNKGKFEETGDADEIYAHPFKKYTQRLINAIPKL